MPVTVSIIIPVYKDWERLELCLKALKNQSFPSENFEVVVINNDPTETPPIDLNMLSNVVLTTEATPGSYAARNTGLGLAKGKIIGFTDSDCVPDEHWIENAVDFLARHQSFTRVAGPVRIMRKSSRPSVVERYNELYAFPQEWLIANGGGSVTANLFVHKHVIDTVGGFDEKILSMGDKYWGMKAQAAGFKIAYVENVVVHHPARQMKELISKEKRHGGGVKDSLPKNRLLLYLNFLYEFRPRMSGIKFMLGRGKEKRLIDRVTIPLLRHYLLLVRKYETLKIHLGKTKPSRV